MICSLGTVIYFLLNLIQRPNFEFKALNTKKKKEKKERKIKQENRTLLCARYLAKRTLSPHFDGLIWVIFLGHFHV